MESKKGVSTVVATVLILLLTISAFALLSQFLLPWFRDNLPDIDCKNYQNYFSIEENIDNGTGEFNYNCFENNGPTLIGLSIKGKPEFSENLANLAGFQVLLRNESEVAAFKVIKGQYTQSVNDMDDLSHPLQYPGPNEVITYSYNSNKPYTEAEIYALTTSGKVCGMADSITISPCKGGVDLR